MQTSGFSFVWNAIVNLRESSATTWSNAGGHGAEARDDDRSSAGIGCSPCTVGRRPFLGGESTASGVKPMGSFPRQGERSQVKEQLKAEEP